MNSVLSAKRRAGRVGGADEHVRLGPVRASARRRTSSRAAGRRVAMPSTSCDDGELVEHAGFRRRDGRLVELLQLLGPRQDLDRARGSTHCPRPPASTNGDTTRCREPRRSMRERPARVQVVQEHLVDAVGSSQTTRVGLLGELQHPRRRAGSRCLEPSARAGCARKSRERALCCCGVSSEPLGVQTDGQVPRGVHGEVPGEHQQPVRRPRRASSTYLMNQILGWNSPAPGAGPGGSSARGRPGGRAPAPGRAIAPAWQ